MNVYTTENIRNASLMGHGSVGKTTLGEAGPFVSGVRLWSVSEDRRPTHQTVGCPGET